MLPLLPPDFDDVDNFLDIDDLLVFMGGQGVRSLPNKDKTHWLYNINIMSCTKTPIAACDIFLKTSQ